MTEVIDTRTGAATWSVNLLMKHYKAFPDPHANELLKEFMYALKALLPCKSEDVMVDGLVAIKTYIQRPASRMIFFIKNGFLSLVYSTIRREE